ncbi:hypothetical protein B4U79_17356 [Dinothrombium tinctorium]|uniref:Fibronectin type-III domain-containing protein n=1 Tax=Dinothrombium tinctorium TaxID=1965070 RepID=A0A3S4R9Z7_9ACAR|nr:hypothetical protein B4U79_17356 [Dinothrombium tinctorium]
MNSLIIFILIIFSIAFQTNLASNAPEASVLEIGTSSVSLIVEGDVLLKNSTVTSIEISYTYADGDRTERARKSTNGDFSDIRDEHENKVARSLLSQNHGQTFSEIINITNLSEGRKYLFTIRLINKAKQKSDPTDLYVLLLPAAPGVETLHEKENKLILKWFGGPYGHEDYFLVNVVKSPFSHCDGLTLNISVCYAMQHSFSDLQRHITYRFTITAHNPSGFGPSAVISYPID